MANSRLRPGEDFYPCFGWSRLRQRDREFVPGCNVDTIGQACRHAAIGDINVDAIYWIEEKVGTRTNQRRGGQPVWKDRGVRTHLYINGPFCSKVQNFSRDIRYFAPSGKMRTISLTVRIKDNPVFSCLVYNNDRKEVFRSNLDNLLLSNRALLSVSRQGKLENSNRPIRIA